MGRYTREGIALFLVTAGELMPDPGIFSFSFDKWRTINIKFSH